MLSKSDTLVRNILADLKLFVLNLKILPYKEKSKITYKDFYSFRISGTYCGIDTYGWGSDENQNLAIFKALMEFVERICYMNSCPLYFSKKYSFNKLLFQNIVKENFESAERVWGETSSGNAIHLSAQKAKMSAKKELIERHTILFSLLTNTKPTFVKESMLDNQLTASHWIYPKHLGLYTSVFKLKNVKYEGAYYYCGAGGSVEEALFKAELESVPMIYTQLNDVEDPPKKPSCKISTIEQIQNFHSSSGSPFMDSFFDKRNSESLFPKFKTNKYYYCKLKNPLQRQKRLHCYKCINPDLINLFMDSWKEKYISNFIKLHFNTPLPPVPHFIV